MSTDALLKFFLHHRLELGSLVLLGLSLWIAFGPMRHRLPRVITRFSKYSAALKLLTLSGLCWFGLYQCLTDDEPSAALNWLLGALGLILLFGAFRVFTFKHAHPARPKTDRKGSGSRPVSGDASRE